MAYDLFSLRRTNQTEPIPGQQQVKNNAGGFVYAVDKWKQLERFLILGSEGGTYYVGEKKLTKENALNVMSAIAEDGARAVRIICDISDAGRAAKNDPAIFALALAASAEDIRTRQIALAALPKVCRIPTHLFHFVTYVKNMRGFGRGLRTALAKWYNDKDVDTLAFHSVKYQSRDGWSNADVIRLAHPKTDDDIRNAVYAWMLKGDNEEIHDRLPRIIRAFESAKKANARETISLIREHNLTREMINNEHLKDPDVWDALLEKMPLEAMMRNLGNMSKVELLKPLSNAEQTVTNRLGNQELLKKARLHPLSILVAMKIYAQGRGMKGDGTWKPVPRVVSALDDAFYKAFQYLEPTGKRFFFGIDVSGSMSSPIAGMPISSCEAAGAMAMAIVKTEPRFYAMGFCDRFVDLGINDRMSLLEVTRTCQWNNFGRTDCSLPMIYAKDHKLEVDAFIVITDNETYAGRIHPSQALKEYREKMGINAKQVVMATTPSPFSIADPKDAGTLDVVGFDTAVPTVITNFIRE